MAIKTNGDTSAPGSYEIELLEIQGEFGTVDIAAIMQQLEIVEDINTMSISGFITVTDSINILSNLPVVEGDLLVGFITVHQNDPWVMEFDPDSMIEFEFEIIKIVDHRRQKQDMQTWKLSFVGTTWCDNFKNRMSKGFCQRPYTDAVQEIYDDMLCQGGIGQKLAPKALDIETSDEIFNFIIPNWRPYEAINWLASRSWIGDNANFIFYEDKWDCHFVTMEKLYATAPILDFFTKLPNKLLEDVTYDQLIDEGMLKYRYANLHNIRLIDTQDITQASHETFFGRRMITHDIVKKKVKDYWYKGTEAPNYVLDEPRDYTDDFGVCSDVGLGDPLILDKFSVKMGAYEGNPDLAVTPIHFEQWTPMPEFMPEKWLRQHRAQLSQSDHVMIYGEVPGNFTLKAGDQINVEMFSPEWNIKPRGTDWKPDKRFDTTWLISSLKRVFNQQEHVTVLKLIQNSRGISPDHIWEPSPREDNTNEQYGGSDLAKG